MGTCRDTYTIWAGGSHTQQGPNAGKMEPGHQQQHANTQLTLLSDCVPALSALQVSLAALLSPAAAPELLLPASVTSSTPSVVPGSAHSFVPCRPCKAAIACCADVNVT
jgi:hypothetical protein